MILQSQFIESFQTKENYSLQESFGLKIVSYTNKVQAPCLAIWQGRQGKPFAHHYYKNDEQRAGSLNGYIDRAKGRFEWKENRKNERKAFVPKSQIGDIFYSSWGYEQTNVSFYQVIEKPSKHFVIVREIAQTTVEDSTEGHGMACNVTAVKDSFLERSEPMKYKVSLHGDSEGITINSSETAWSWDGKPKYKSWYY